jgi:DNA-binding SARP family transcriptional activator
MRVALFGGLRVEDGARMIGPKDLGGTRPKQLFEILLLARGHRVSSERLAEALWGPTPPDNVAGSIQTFVSVLRRSLVADRARARRLIVTEPGSYRVATELIDLDLDEFDTRLGRAAHEPPWMRRRAVEEALRLANGDVLEDEPYAAWAQDVRRDYRTRVVEAHLDAAAMALTERDLADAVAHADAASARDRFNERALRTAMLALYAQGGQHESLARYRVFRETLDNELGLTPSADLRALESAILRQESAEALLPRACTGSRGDLPRGEVPLLGRSDELQRLESAVRRGVDTGFALVQLEGESGMGKTRLLHHLADHLGGLPVGWATCSLLEQHLQYVPLAAALRQAGLPAAGAGSPALGQILPELARDNHRSDEVETLEALVRVFAEEGPLVLLIDDLQLADPATIGALSYLHRRRSGLRGAVVVGVRTEHAPDHHALRALRPDVVIKLCPLRADDLESLGIPDVYESTGGNPRFIADALSNSEGPSRGLTETVLAQCRGEGPRGYRVLIAASLLDPPFEPHDVESMLGSGITGIAEALELLCDRRLLQTDGVGFRFRYEVVREVLLDTLSPARVRLLQQRLQPVRLSDFG